MRLGTLSALLCTVIFGFTSGASYQHLNRHIRHAGSEAVTVRCGCANNNHVSDPSVMQQSEDQTTNFLTEAILAFPHSLRAVRSNLPISKHRFRTTIRSRPLQRTSYNANIFYEPVGQDLFHENYYNQYPSLSEPPYHGASVPLETLHTSHKRNNVVSNSNSVDGQAPDPAMNKKRINSPQTDDEIDTEMNSQQSIQTMHLFLDIGEDLSKTKNSATLEESTRIKNIIIVQKDLFGCLDFILTKELKESTNKQQIQTNQNENLTLQHEQSKCKIFDRIILDLRKSIITSSRINKDKTSENIVTSPATKNKQHLLEEESLEFKNASLKRNETSNHSHVAQILNQDDTVKNILFKCNEINTILASDKKSTTVKRIDKFTNFQVVTELPLEFLQSASDKLIRHDHKATLKTSDIQQKIMENVILDKINTNCKEFNEVIMVSKTATHNNEPNNISSPENDFFSTTTEYPTNTDTVTDTLANITLDLLEDQNLARTETTNETMKRIQIKCNEINTIIFKIKRNSSQNSPESLNKLKTIHADYNPQTDIGLNSANNKTNDFELDEDWFQEKFQLIRSKDNIIQNIKNTCKELENVISNRMDNIDGIKTNNIAHSAVSMPALDFSLPRGGVASYYEESTDSEISDSAGKIYFDRYSGFEKILATDTQAMAAEKGTKNAVENNLLISVTSKGSVDNIGKKDDMFKHITMITQADSTLQSTQFTEFTVAQTDNDFQTTSMYETNYNRKTEDWLKLENENATNIPSLSTIHPKQETEIIYTRYDDLDTTTNNPNHQNSQYEPNFTTEPTIITDSLPITITPFDKSAETFVSLSINNTDKKSDDYNEMNGKETTKDSQSLFDTERTAYKKDILNDTTTNALSTHNDDSIRTTDSTQQDMSLTTAEIFVQNKDDWRNGVQDYSISTVVPLENPVIGHTERKHIEEDHILVPKINSFEMKNGSIVSTMSGFEKIPNSDFDNSTETYLYSETTRENLSSSVSERPGMLNIISGKMIFLHNRHKIPLQFLQNSNGNMDLVIDGNFVCTNLMADHQESLILAVLCNNTSQIIN